VRAAVIATWPQAAHSDDLDSWRTVAQALSSGANPYITTTIVKWPPFALIVVWLVDHVARALDISFFLSMRIALIAAESAIVVVLYLMLTRFAPARTSTFSSGSSLPSHCGLWSPTRERETRVFATLCRGLSAASPSASVPS
jgi:hypothetical protein